MTPVIKQPVLVGKEEFNAAVSTMRSGGERAKLKVINECAHWVCSEEPHTTLLLEDVNGHGKNMRALIENGADYNAYLTGGHQGEFGVSFLEFAQIFFQYDDEALISDLLRWNCGANFPVEIKNRIFENPSLNLRYSAMLARIENDALLCDATELFAKESPSRRAGRRF